jgi:molybdenum cofactor cytidylyltransferase
MLLPFRSTNILTELLTEIKNFHSTGICLVTGCYHQLIIDSIDSQNLHIVFNDHWKEGISTSIIKGLMTLMERDKEMTDVCIVVCDQPFLDYNILKKMKQLRLESKKGIIAAKYGDIIGTPVLFNKKYFDSLMQLKGDTGAKSILKRHIDDIATVEFDLGYFDIDTKEDYINLRLNAQ